MEINPFASTTCWPGPSQLQEMAEGTPRKGAGGGGRWREVPQPWHHRLGVVTNHSHARTRRLMYLFLQTSINRNKYLLTVQSDQK